MPFKVKPKKYCIVYWVTSTSLMHSVIQMSRHAHPGRLPRALSHVVKKKKKSAEKRYVEKQITLGVNVPMADTDSQGMSML